MYNYINDISGIAHYIIEKFVENKNIAVDCTLGNGYDTNFLRVKFNFVYAFDIQEEACLNYEKNNYPNVSVINKSHSFLKQILMDKKVDCIMYNLGFLPGSNHKEITTNHETTLKSIKEGLEILQPGGIMTICIYIGHDEGKKEESCIMPFLESLKKSEFAVMKHEYLNRSKLAPMLVIVEKNNIKAPD